MKSLIGIGQFPSLGGLFLSYNDLNWREVNRLHHMHILRLTLIGNPQLDCDPNCKNTHTLYTHMIGYILQTVAMSSVCYHMFGC